MKNAEVIAENNILKIQNKNLNELLKLSEEENEEFRKGNITHYQGFALKSDLQQPNLEQAQESAHALAMVVFGTNLRINSRTEYSRADGGIIEGLEVFVGGNQIPYILGSYFLKSLKELSEA